MRSSSVLFLVAVQVMVSACSDGVAGTSSCESWDPPPPLCNQQCTADDQCGTGLHCDEQNRCQADCSIGGGECGLDQRCDERGRCQPRPAKPCDSAGAPSGCGASCAVDTECDPGLHCEGATACTAVCISGAGHCAFGSRCDERGRCVAVDTTIDCPDVAVAVSAVIPRVMLLIDRSGSMDASFGRINNRRVDRWAAVRYALTDAKAGAVARLEDKVQFGASLYHSTGGSAGGQCPILTDTTATRSVSFGARATIDALMADNDPVRDTPTAESIKAVVTRMKAWPDGNPDVQLGPKVLLLATDGDPDNCGDPDAHNLTSQRMSETEVEAAFAAGIRSYVLSVGSNVSTSHLQKLANAGVGKPLTPADAPFYRGNDPAELVEAFDQIIRGVRECVFNLDKAVQPQYASQGKVSLNGKSLAFDVDWALTDSRTLELKGDACQTFLGSETVTFDATFPCGTVIK